MNEIKEFFSRYFAERTKRDRAYWEYHSSLRPQFFTSAPQHDPGKEWIAKREAESVIGLHQLGGDRAEVQTSGEGMGPKRYMLSRLADGWRIERVECACPFCNKSGDIADGARKSCKFCKGSGWKNGSD